MSLQFVRENLDGLDENQQSLYEKVGDKYQLKVEGLPSDKADELEKLRRKNEELLTEAKKAKETKRQAEEEARKKAEEMAEKKGDIQALKKSYEEKLADKDRELEEMKASIGNKELSKVATEIAASLADGANQKLLTPFIEKRLRYQDDKVHVTSVDGELTVSSFEQLADEFRGNKDFGSLITGSKSSGTGGSGSSQSSGGNKKFSEMNETERLTLYRENPELYRELRDAEKN